jgi:hypothetical protein
MTSTAVRPFHIDVPEEELVELRRRIAATRWPSKELVDDSSQGVQLATIHELARYWATDYDSRKCEERLNALLDSPLGLAAWMLDHDADRYEKISHAFLDGQPSGNLTRDHVLDNITPALRPTRCHCRQKLSSNGGTSITLPPNAAGPAMTTTATILPSSFGRSPRHNGTSMMPPSIAASFENPDHVDIVIHNYRWRLGLAEGEPRYDDLEKRLAEGPVVTVPTITLEGDANGAPHPDATSYEEKFSGKYAHRVITGGVGHNLPQEAPQGFAEAVFEVDGY